MKNIIRFEEYFPLTLGKQLVLLKLEYPLIKLIICFENETTSPPKRVLYCNTVKRHCVIRNYNNKTSVLNFNNYARSETVSEGPQ